MLEDYEEDSLEALYAQVDGEDPEPTASSREHTPVRGRLCVYTCMCTCVCVHVPVSVCVCIYTECPLEQ